ncbi:MAG TPA: hypothetical protein V6D22_20560 [Candidatus Obscuribacterales bacterium]
MPIRILLSATSLAVLLAIGLRVCNPLCVPENLANHQTKLILICDEPYDPGKEITDNPHGPNPHGDNPHGPDPQDEVHDRPIPCPDDENRK